MEVQKNCDSADNLWNERHIGYEVRTLDNTIGRLVRAYQSRVDEKAGITRMQGWIIGYLYQHSGQDIFQRDLETRVSDGTFHGIWDSAGYGEEAADHEGIHSKGCQTEASGTYR